MKTYSNSDTQWQLRHNLVLYWRAFNQSSTKEQALRAFRKYESARSALMLLPHEAAKFVDLYTVRSYTRAS